MIASGCWATWYHGDCGATIASVHSRELDALRAAVTSVMDAAVIWLPWGASLADAIKAAEPAKRAAAAPSE